VKPSRYIDSVNCAIEGIFYAARNQRHMRNHFLAAFAVLMAVLLLRVSTLEFTLLAISVFFVLFAELFNTAIEICVDLISPDYHPLAKAAKDVAAGAVLTAAIGAAVMGYLILARYIFPLYKEMLAVIGTPAEMATLVAILGVMIVVVILKAWGGKGTPLEGGAVSGHAAVAFSIATLVSFSTGDPISSILTLVLAFMVSGSRIALRLHAFREVVAGALVGVTFTFGVLILFNKFN
jgi:diacylglycerol kinase (ATP)